MLPVWFFSALLLSSVLGHPIVRNDTRNGTSNDEDSRVRAHSSNISSVPSNESQDSSCNETVPRFFNGFPLYPMGLACSLSTCIIHDVDSKLRPGDKKAGGDASSPHGPGKK
ncbi:hypothetical protein AMELA_G00163720 [Ameiurus melas]|uniref:Uncharacterized protein n=1 Tax=Ameiurus melas TaxID=219545 RepID=A0A7J6AJI2_AMEME|nr:hypothetical protein AMELA_G00163720 [Ameiurus melas]